jgi:hypothetical protein
MRRQFALPEDDEDCLNALGCPWETIRDSAGQWLIIHEWPLPSGYNCETASVAISIPSGFPTAHLDMAYFSPDLSRADGVPIKQVQARQTIDHRAWQRWSRHYPWRPGVDCIATHLTHVKHWLQHAVGGQI